MTCCCPLAVLVPILAATLSSTDIDEFFTLPSWMPTTVSSHDTPGSDPAGGGGWYVEEYDTNSVSTGSYVPRSPRLSPEIQAGVLSTFAAYCERQYYASQGQSNVWDEATWGPHNSKKAFWFDPTAYYTLTTTTYWKVSTPFGNFDSVYISYYRGIGYYIGNVAANVVHSLYGAIDSLSPEYIQSPDGIMTLSGSFVMNYSKLSSLSTILTTNVTFTAWRKVTTNFHGGVEFAYQPTNRVISSRRLVEYDNMKHLADYLLGDFSYNCFAIQAPLRPGWLSGTGDYYRRRMFWSTTDDTVLDGDDIVPSFDTWTQFAYDHSDWRKCSQTFRCLANDEVWDRFDDSSNLREHPTSMIMDEVGYGEYGSDNEKCEPDSVPVSMKGLIETNFPHADGCAITNDTRRILSDRLCCMNQLLGLMDRTYHVPEVVYPARGTNIVFRNVAAASGTARITGYTRTESKELSATVSAPSWTSTGTDNSRTDTSVDADDNAVHMRVSGTSTIVSAGAASTNHWQVGVSDEIVQEVLNYCREELFDIEEGQEFELVFQGLSGIWEIQGGYCGHIKWALKIDGEEWINGEVIHADFPPETMLNVAMTYTRQYTYAGSVGSPHFLVTQPGSQGFTRSSSKYGRIVGVHYKHEYDSSLSILRYDRRYSTCNYKSYSDKYESRNELLSVVEGGSQEASTYFTHRYGVGPTIWESIIPIDETDFNNVKASLRVVNCHIMCMRTGWQTVVTGNIIDGGEHEITSVYSTSQVEGKSIRGYAGLLARDTTVGTTYDSPSQVERQPLSMDAKVGIITRVDWDWKTLKRNN